MATATLDFPHETKLLQPMTQPEGTYDAATHAGKLVVVGGHSRGVGKTSVAQGILRSTPGTRWTAIKVSKHRHSENDEPHRFLVEETEASANTQCARYLAAGASRALLLRASDEKLPIAVRYIRRLLASGENLIVESNRVAEHCTPDLVVFVIDQRNTDWKSSSGACLCRADAVVLIDSDDLPREALLLARKPSAQLLRFRVPRGVYWSSSFEDWIRTSIGPRRY